MALVQAHLEYLNSEHHISRTTTGKLEAIQRKAPEMVRRLGTHRQGKTRGVNDVCFVKATSKVKAHNSIDISAGYSHQGREKLYSVAKGVQLGVFGMKLSKKTFRMDSSKLLLTVRCIRPLVFQVLEATLVGRCKPDWKSCKEMAAMLETQ